MLKKIYDVNVFDDSSIKAMIIELEKYRDDLSHKMDMLIRRLNEEGVHYAKIYISQMDWYGTLGWISSQINSFYDATSHKGVIKIDDSRAAFVEFGTGIVGSTSPHPGELFGWEYNTMGHGASGWLYPTTERDPNPNKTIRNGKLYAWTAGMPSRPFMYDAGIHLELVVDQIAREVFGA